MKSLHTTSLSGQRGSFYTVLIMLAMFGFLVTCALKIAPLYIDNNVITNAMAAMAANEDMKSLSIGEIRSSLAKTLNTNNIDNFDTQNVVLVREDGMDYVDINYDARVHLFSNIDAVVVFTNRFDKF